MATPAIPNYDSEAKIHFGVISNHSVDTEALSDIYDKGENLSHAEYVVEVKSHIRSAISDVVSRHQLDSAVDSAFDAIEDEINDSYHGEDEQYLYQQNGYKISNSPSLVCLFVQLSPYYTYAAACSPCAPNAGDLDKQGSFKSYCLGPEWFENDKAPYPVYCVKTDVRK